MGLARGHEALMDLTLEEGNYVLTCFIPDAKDGKPHFMHGMTMAMTVGR